MASNFHRAVLIAAAASSVVFAEDRLVNFDLKSDAPLHVESMDDHETRVSSRAGAQVVDLHVVAKLRNTSHDTIRGVTLLLLAQESTPGGKMSVAVPSINVGPNEVFPVRIDGRLMRPAQAGTGAPVRVTIDGVLFKNYEFYGPDRLNSHRQMLAWEMQAERDRKYFKQVLQTAGPGGLRQEMLESLKRQADRPHLDVQLARGRATGDAAALSPDHVAQFAFLQIPDSPIKPMNGFADIARNEAHNPNIEIQNTSPKFIHYVEIAWVVKDMQGREYMAGSVPASEGELYLPPGQRARLLQDTSLRFSHHGGQPVDIQTMKGFVSQVEYSDHTIWIPKRESLKNSDLWRALPPSPEEQRLTDLYNHNGLDALVHELSRF